MATLPNGITQADLDRYARLDVAIKKAKAEHDTLNAKIKAAFVSLGTFVFGSVIIKRTEAVTFDSKAATEALPYAQFSDYYDLVPVLNKALLPEEVRRTFESAQQRLSVDVASS